MDYFQPIVPDKPIEYNDDGYFQEIIYMNLVVNALQNKIVILQIHILIMNIMTICVVM